MAAMLSVADAQAIILQHARRLPTEMTPLTSASLGLLVAEDVVSDLDMPPFDKALMDGYAVRAGDLQQGRSVLTVVEEVMAGQTPSRALGPGETTRIMTGAPIPAGADAVVIVERTQALPGQRVQIDDRPPEPGQNILHRGREMHRGEVVVSAGTLLRPQAFGLLAAVGRTSVRIQPRPRIAILPTGDELVEPDLTPGPGQIRNGNGPMLAGQVARAGGLPRLPGIARDRHDSLGPMIEEGLRSPILVLSGGVSAGKLDLVPGVLQELGVVAHFHKIAMKPGKPLFFGTRDETLVFGLPGNPVSSMVCFELFVRPAIRQMMGHSIVGPCLARARLEKDLSYSSDRPTYYPAVIRQQADGWSMCPLDWFGSADLRGVLEANALLVLAAGQNEHRAGDTLDVVMMDAG